MHGALLPVRQPAIQVPVNSDNDDRESRVQVPNLVGTDRGFCATRRFGVAWVLKCTSPGRADRGVEYTLHRTGKVVRAQYWAATGS